MEFLVINGIASAKTKATLSQSLSFDRVNSNGKAYSVFTAKTAEGQTVSGIIYQNLADKLGADVGSEVTLTADAQDILQGVNNHWSPSFDVVSSVSDADKASAKAFLDSLK